MYPWVIFLHILGVFLFLLGHGGSAMVSLKLRGEREMARVHALLELSTYSLTFMYLGLLLLLATGIIAGFMGNWWGQGWIWAALGLLVAIFFAMGFLGSLYYSRFRKAVGLPFFEGFKQLPPVEPVSQQELEALLSSSPSRPILLAVIGSGGIVVITWLMMFKPF